MSAIKQSDKLTDTGYLKTLLKVLEKIKISRDDCGICLNILRKTNYDNYVVDIFKAIYKEWPKYSGNPQYPIKLLSDNNSSAAQFVWACNYWTGEYGQLRMELLDFSIASLKLALKIK